MIKTVIEFLWNIPTFLMLILNQTQPRFLLLMTPQYVNYGDHAIAEAEKNYLKTHCPHVKIVEVNTNFLELWFAFFKKHVTKKDILLITGGGFMGDLWPGLQNMAERIISSFPENPIVFFPQTIHFSQFAEPFQQFRSLILKHPHIIIFAREEKTFSLLREHLVPERKENCFLIPDMVLSYHLPFQPARHGSSTALFCIREDHERILSPEAVEKMKNLLFEKGMKIQPIRMARSHMEFPVWLRSFFLKKKFSEYASGEFLITDRLHGMVFAVITGTPCLVFDNVSKKISMVYQWIREMPGVIMGDPSAPVESLQLFFKQISNQEQSCEKICSRRLEEAFSSLDEVLHKELLSI